MSTSRQDAYVVRCDYHGCGETTIPLYEAEIADVLDDLGWAWLPSPAAPRMGRRGRHYCPTHLHTPAGREPRAPSLWQDESGNWWATSQRAPGDSVGTSVHVMLTGDRPGRWDTFEAIVARFGRPREVYTPTVTRVDGLTFEQALREGDEAHQ